MNARQIKRAWEEHLPVIVCNPNEPPIECSYITEVIYSFSRSGKKRVSCVCQDARCPHSVIRARARNIKLKEQRNEVQMQA